MNTDAELELASEGRSKLTMLGGIIAAVVAAAGLIGSGAILITTLTHFLDNSPLYAAKHLVVAVMWVVFFIALLVAGIQLVKSGLSRRMYNLVPGISYFFIHQQFLFAAVAIILGLVLVLAEWGTETI